MKRGQLGMLLSAIGRALKRGVYLRARPDAREIARTDTPASSNGDHGRLAASRMVTCDH